LIKVTAAIIKKDDKILICQRGEGGNCQNLWEFPGGKQEENETLEECLIRECREELSIDIKVNGVFANTSYKYPDKEIELTFFEAEITGGAIHENVHKCVRWVDIDGLRSYEFCPADIEVVEKLCANVKAGKRVLKIGKKYRHFKGNEYLVLYQAKHSETLEDLVVYQTLYGERGIWVRPLEMFLGQKEVKGKLVNRFEEVE
jgi:8-oxo-dGTP diphosphatase